MALRILGSGGRSMRRAFCVLNPSAGGTMSAALVPRIERAMEASGWEIQICEVTEGTNIGERVEEGVAHGFDTFIAAGGDGTIAAVAGALVGTDRLLGILPVGTGNVLARELGIPMRIGRALQVITDGHEVRKIDGMQVGDRHFFLNVGTGINARIMRDTDRGDKRRFGRVAYVWTGLKALFDFQPHRFSLIVDGERSSHRASEVFVANSGVLGDPSLRWEPSVQLDDGHLNVCIIRARTILDYLRVGWRMLTGGHKREPGVECRLVDEDVTIQAERALPLQADGEFIGETPITVHVVPEAASIAVPEKRGRPLGSLIGQPLATERTVDEVFPELNRRLRMIWRH